VARVKIGLIGCGIISDAHLKGYEVIKDLAQVVAVADVDKKKAEEKAKKTGASKVYLDYKELLKDRDIEAVDICLPHHLHRQVACDAASEGKHIICEKPLATSIKDADAMIVKARDSKVILYTAENYRFIPPIVKAKEIIDKGEIGTVTVVRGSFTSYLSGVWLTTPWRFKADEIGGGVLIDSGIHFVSTLRYLGGDIETIKAYTRRVRDDFATEDIALFISRFKNGILGELFASAASPSSPPENNFTVLGTKGALAVNGPDGALSVYKSDLPGKRSVLMDNYIHQDSYTGEIKDFVLSVSGRKKPEIPGEEGREDLRVVLAAYESARTGREVLVSEVR
jgi:predicted dehydrogenase